jgi:antitoxin component YwqK of YwqJK toxin-antitoxin module
MKLTIYTFLAVFVLAGCDGSGEGNPAEIRERDSLSRLVQREHADSMKKKNPLLIMPPDSSYTGSYVDKYPSGVTKFTGFFRFGKKHGQWVSFYPSGTPWSELHFEKGVRHGPNITWFPNGKKRFEGQYKNDHQDSIWIYYDSTGKAAERVFFEKGRLTRRLNLEQ